jgi:amino acid transporter
LRIEFKCVRRRESAVAAFLRLDQLVSALITTRILVQFLGQLFAIPLLRRKLPESARPYKMWLYPLPVIIAFFGWAYIFLTSGWLYIKIGLLTLLVGTLVFFIWAKSKSAWPFGMAGPSS